MGINEMTFGDRVRYRRKELDMSQETLALKLGFARKSAVSAIETGRCELSISKLPLMAELLETSVTWLLGLEPDVVYVKEHADLCDAYERADYETRVCIDRLLGLKKGASYMSTIFGRSAQ